MKHGIYRVVIILCLPMIAWLTFAPSSQYTTFHLLASSSPLPPDFPSFSSFLPSPSLSLRPSVPPSLPPASLPPSLPPSLRPSVPPSSLPPTHLHPPLSLQVGNFRVEPPGLFRGRGEHPKVCRHPYLHKYTPRYVGMLTYIHTPQDMSASVLACVGSGRSCMSLLAQVQGNATLSSLPPSLALSLSLSLSITPSLPHSLSPPPLSLQLTPSTACFPLHALLLCLRSCLSLVHVADGVDNNTG